MAAASSCTPFQISAFTKLLKKYEANKNSSIQEAIKAENEMKNFIDRIMNHKYTITQANGMLNRKKGGASSDIVEETIEISRICDSGPAEKSIIDKAIDPILQQLLAEHNYKAALYLALTSKVIYNKLPAYYTDRLNAINYVSKVLDRAGEIEITREDDDRPYGDGNVITKEEFINNLFSNKEADYSILIDAAGTDRLKINIYKEKVDAEIFQIDADMYTVSYHRERFLKRVTVSVDDKDSKLMILKKITFNLKKLSTKIKKIRGISAQAQQGGSTKHTYKNRLYTIFTGSRGGKYIVVKGEKKYI